MPRPKTSRLTVDLELGADPIRGSIAHSDGQVHQFWGWLELIEALERAAAPRGRPGAPTPQHTQRSKT